MTFALIFALSGSRWPAREEMGMSKQQVVAEYLAGRIGRREFIRRLTMAGVSAAAAVAYAETLSQSVAARGAGRDARGYLTAFQTTPDYPVLDTDGDGFTDQEEADCGSDPNDPNSTCDNVGEGPGAFTFTIPIDITINLPGGPITIGAGSVITISVGVPAGGGFRATLHFVGTINGQPADITATIFFAGGSASRTALRALAADTNLQFTIEEFTNWNAPGLDEPATPLDVTVSGSGNVFTVTVGGATSTVTIPSGSNNGGNGGPTGLPNTGTGDDGSSASSWLAPVLAAGGGIALLARKLRGRSELS